MVRQHGEGNDAMPHLTQAASAAERTGYFDMILTRHADWIATRPDEAVFLLTRQLKMVAKARNAKAAQQILAWHTAKPHQLPLTLYYAALTLPTLFRHSKV